MARTEKLFVTTLYRAKLPARLNTELSATAIAVAAEDKAGRSWSKAHHYKGYTSYASLNDLPRRAPAFEALHKILDSHVAAFARQVQFDLHGRHLVLDSLWINLLKRGGIHAPHIHPHAAVSGTCYVRVPKESSAIRFEDPRLGLMMAAPPRQPKAKPENRNFISVIPEEGMILIWESWLRHGVETHTVREDRISLSFNYRLD
jgi:uncharacterized protein (TIGR02466 family)